MFTYFETGRYYAPSDLPQQWPMPAGTYNLEAGSRAFRGMVKRSRYAEELEFDWVSVSEHHYPPRILTPPRPTSPRSAQHQDRTARADRPQSNPVLLAEEMAMLDTMAEGRLIVVRFAPDSLLEGDGFELPVPRQGQRVFATPVQFSSYPPVGKTLFLWDRDAGPPPPYRLSSYNMPRRSGPATRSVAPDTAGVKSPAPTPSWRKTP